MISVYKAKARFLSNLFLAHGHEVVTVCAFVIGLQLTTIDLCHTYFVVAIVDALIPMKLLLLGVAAELEEAAVTDLVDSP